MKNANDAKPTAAQRAETYKESEQQFENVPESVAARTEGVMDTNPAFAGDPNSAPENGEEPAGDEDDDPAPAPGPEPPATPPAPPATKGAEGPKAPGAPEPPIAPEPEPPAVDEAFVQAQAEIIEAQAGSPAGASPSVAPVPGVATAEETTPAVRRELDRLGQRRAHKVYDWLGFIGGVFALALGITMLTVGLPSADVEFGANFYTFTYVAIAQTALLIKLGFFGVLVAVGLGLMGTFGPRLLKDDRHGRRHYH